MKRILLILIALVLLLVACQAQPAEVMPEPEYTYYAEELEPEPLAGVEEAEPEPPTVLEEPEPGPEDEPENRIPTLEEQIQFLESSIPFVIPQLGCDLEDELLGFVYGWWREYLFPEFVDISDMPFEAMEVASSLFFKAGISTFPADGSPWVVPLEDMNTVGRRFFGSGFSFPPDVTEAWEIAPTQIDGEYYYKSIGGRGGMSRVRYLLVNSLVNGDEVTATFLPYVPHFSWYDESLMSISLLYRHTRPNGFESIWAPHEIYYFDIPEGHEVLLSYEGNVLDYVRLRVPQETLGTLTVTFTREDGRLIAVSSILNDNHQK